MQIWLQFLLTSTSALRDDAYNWFDVHGVDVPSCSVIIAHLELFLDEEPRVTSDNRTYANGRCLAFIEFPREAVRALNRLATMQTCEFLVLLNHDETRQASDLYTHRIAPSTRRFLTAGGPLREGFESYKTAPSNVNDRFSGFSLSEKPPAIQDAVAVTRALSIPYVWIDAICIIQGDQDDWLREGTQMDKVYENAFITIAAIATDSVWHSFLERRSICADVTFIETGETTDVATNSLSFRYPYCRDNSNFMLDAPWTKRAWCMQEQLLSTPTLHFTPQIFYIECLCGHEMEIMAHGLPKRNTRPWLKSRASNAQVDSQVLYRDWYSIVEQYTTRKITFESDRIIAIAGLANRLARELPGDAYKVGLFMADISRGLLWSPDAIWQPCSRRNDGVPSWSRASFPGAVLYELLDSSSDDEKEETSSMCSALPSPIDDRLVLSGKLVSIQDLWPDPIVVPDQHEVDTSTYVNAWTFWPDLREDEVKASDTFALTVRRTEYEVCGLLLENTKEETLSNPARFCRRGYFELSHDGGPSLFDAIAEG